MDDLIETVKEFVKKKCTEYKENALDHYDFWNEHIKYVYYESLILAKKYNADENIVSLGALLHDIALVEKVGDKKDHHINGKIISNDILDRLNCPSDIKERVLGCIFNHRSSQNATNIEELCVADADILAHFDNIPMLFNSGLVRNGVNISDIRKWIKEVFEKDFNDLSEKTRETFNERYKEILDIVLNER